jgi:L-2-hydroxyglutarate oxidase LhgO
MYCREEVHVQFLRKVRVCRSLYFFLLLTFGLPHSGRNLIGHRKIGKWIFGQTFESEGYLQGLKERCDDLKVPVSFLSKRQIEQGEPLLRASVAVESPETGVVDAGGFMRYLEFQIEERGGSLLP